MSQPNEPEKYSIDEMMERLQSRPDDASPEDGELVIRADGSQAIKVRKRKRRSRQPHKEKLVISRRAKIIQVAASLVILLLAIFGCGIALIYANSAPFREGLAGMIASRTSATVELGQFRMTPTRANAGQIHLNWPEGNAIQEISCRNISATITPSSFLGKSIKGDEVTSPEGTMTLRVPDPSKPRLAQAAGQKTSGDVVFKSLSCANLTILLGEKAFPTARISKTEASFVPANSKGLPQLLLNRGELAIPGWPKLLVDRSYIEFRGPVVDVVGMRFRSEKESIGHLEVSGTVSPYETATASILSVELKTFPLAGIVGPEWSRMFNGQVDSRPAAKSNFLVIQAGPDLGGALQVSFAGSAASPFQVSRFPFLFAIGQITDDGWYENPRFEGDASGVLRRSDGGVFFENLNFSNKSRMALRGSVSSSADLKLSGQIKLGLADAVILASKNAKLNNLFGPPDEGFRWLNLKISGTVMSPSDNFRELYEATPEAAAPAAEGTGTPSFEELTHPESRR
jgi:hypothetical protein